MNEMMYLIPTLTLNPFVAIQVAALLQTLWLVQILIGIDQWNLMFIKPLGKFLQIIIYILQALLSTIFIVFSLILIDISFWWLIGSWGFADWWFQIPNFSLAGIIAIYYLYFIVFRNPTKMKIIYVIFAVTLLEIYLHWWVPQDPVMSLRLENGLPFVGGILLLGGFSVQFIEIIKNKKEKLRPVETNIEKKEEKIDRTKKIIAHFVLWILICTQAIISYFGYSLLWFY